MADAGFLKVLQARAEGRQLSQGGAEYYAAHCGLRWREIFSLNISELDKGSFSREAQAGMDLPVGRLCTASVLALPSSMETLGVRELCQPALCSWRLTWQCERSELDGGVGYLALHLHLSGWETETP